MKIGYLIKQIRKHKGWSQARMALALRVSKPTISLYEHDKRCISQRAVHTFMRLFNLASDPERHILREWAKEDTRKGDKR